MRLKKNENMELSEVKHSQIKSLITFFFAFTCIQSNTISKIHSLLNSPKVQLVMSVEASAALLIF